MAPHDHSEGGQELYVISVAAEITGMHAQTLRTYDRLGLVTPQRTAGGGRRYSRRDIDLLKEIQRLSHDAGINLAGIKTIIEQRDHLEQLKEENAALREQVSRLRDAVHSLQNSAPKRSRGEIVHVPRSTAVVMWEPRSGRGSRRDR